LATGSHDAALSNPRFHPKAQGCTRNSKLWVRKWLVSIDKDFLRLRSSWGGREFAYDSIRELILGFESQMLS